MTHGLARLRRDPEIRARKRGAQLGDELFAGVARVAGALATEVAIQTGSCVVQCVSSCAFVAA